MPGGPPAGAPDSDPAPEGDGADIEFVSPRVAGLARSDDGQSIALLYTDPFTSCSFVDSIQVESIDAAHFVQEEKPREVAQLMNAFFQEGM